MISQIGYARKREAPPRPPPQRLGMLAPRRKPGLVHGVRAVQEGKRHHAGARATARVAA